MSYRTNRRHDFMEHHRGELYSADTSNHLKVSSHLTVEAYTPSSPKKFLDSGFHEGTSLSSQSSIASSHLSSFSTIDSGCDVRGVLDPISEETSSLQVSLKTQTDSATLSETILTTGPTTLVQDVKSIPPNTKDTSTHLIDTLPSSPRPVPMSITEDYSQYMEAFFKLFANGLNLREETTYSAFKVDAVEALGFGIRSDRVIPCIKIYTKESEDKWDMLKREVAKYITDAAKETDNVLLSPEDCLRCLEVDNFNNSIIYPEELMGYPGEQFIVSRGAVKGIIGCYLKAELKLGIQGRTICFTKHFALTCAHCVIPVHIISGLVRDACNNVGIQNKIQQYPLTDLYNYMWKHSLYQSMLQYPRDYTSHQQQSKPNAFDGFNFDQEFCMIQGALCFDEMRALINEKLGYDDYETTCQHVQKYKYVCSKYGMIPRHFHLPLPHYIFKNESNTGQVDFHLPFNIDIGVLEINENMPQLDYTHCIGASYHYMSNIGELSGKPIAIDGAPSALSNRELRKPQFRQEMNHVFPSQLSEYSKPYGLVDPRTAYSRQDSVTLSEGYPSLTISPSPTGHGSPMTHCKLDCTTLSPPDHPFLRSVSRDSDCEESLSSPVIGDVLGHQTVGSTTQQLLTSEPIIRDHIHSPAQKETLKTAVKKNISKASSGILAFGRKIFGVKEEKKLRLHVMSHQANDNSRPARRTLEVKNKDFCLELVHRNPNNRQQKRSFPTIKWKSQDENHFIEPGDSGSSLFVIVKDENGSDKLVLLGIAGSATTASRIDFTKEVLTPDLFLYMSSELRKHLTNFPHLNDFISFCETVENQVQIDKELSKLASPTDDKLMSPEYAHLTIPKRKEQICHDIQEKSRLLKKMERSVKFPFSSLAAATEGHVSFKLTECIEDCASSHYDQHDGPIVELRPEMWEQLWS